MRRYGLCLLTFNIDIDLESIRRNLFHDTSTRKGEEVMIQTSSIYFFTFNCYLDLGTIETKLSHDISAC